MDDPDEKLTINTEVVYTLLQTVFIELASALDRKGVLPLSELASQLEQASIEEAPDVNADAKTILGVWARALQQQASRHTLEQ